MSISLQYGVSTCLFEHLVTRVIKRLYAGMVSLEMALIFYRWRAVFLHRILLFVQIPLVEDTATGLIQI
ncbi:MAG: hypothetical protein VW313_11420, partial [Gammaproteobacteria bacterium]